MQTIRINTAQNIDIDYEIASLGDRIIGRLIDIGIFIGVFLLGILIVSTLSLKGDVFSQIIAAIFGLIFLVYDLVFEIFYGGQSIGKKVMKIKVISLNGAQATIGQYFLRWIFRLLDFTITSQVGGLICIAATKNNQRIGDLAAGTTLVRTSPRTTLKDVVFIPSESDYEVIFSEASQLADADVILMHEILLNYKQSKNFMLVSNAAEKIRKILSIKNSPGMNDEQFLLTVINDYNYICSQIEA